MTEVERIYRKNYSEVDIFIYSHCPFTPITGNHIFKVLTNSHEPSFKFGTDLEIFRDYDGKNISDVNLMYNEYCGLFWIWKNYPIKKYVGLNHYRRYYENFHNLPCIDDIFKKNSLILNEPIKLVSKGQTFNNREWYAMWHNIEDFELLEKIIKEKYPEYSQGFDKMAQAKFLNPSNMFTMTKDMFDEYCDFAFSVLLEFRKERGFFTDDDAVKYVEDNKDKYIKPYKTYYDIRMQARIVGYLAERVLGAFLWNNNGQLMNRSHIFKWHLIQKSAGLGENAPKLES